MKRRARYVMAAVFVFFTLAIQRAGAQNYRDDQKNEDNAYNAEKKKSTEGQEAAREATRVNNKICPVDFKSLYEARKKGPKEFFLYTYEGKTYDFDSPACVEKFKNDPQGYLEGWEKKERSRRINVIND